MTYTVGIDLGGSSIKLVAVQPDGAVLFRQSTEFDCTMPMEWAAKIRGLLNEAEGMVGQGQEAAYVGLAAPGLAAADGRSIAYLPQRLHGLEGFDWSNYLRDGRAVPILNDGHAALLGEVWLGAAQQRQNAILLTLGTGVGGAAMVDGKILRGKLGRAGHLGHVSLDPNGPPDICNLPGSLEMAIGNCTIKERTRGRFRTTHDLIAAHLRGDQNAQSIWLTSVKFLAAAICSLINVLDPEVVVIGGGIARAKEALFEPLQWYIDEMEWRPGGHRVEVVPAQLGEFAGAIGAAHHALH